jgi:hypothetical protein
LYISSLCIRRLAHECWHFCLSLSEQTCRSIHLGLIIVFKMSLGASLLPRTSLLKSDFLDNLQYSRPSQAVFHSVQALSELSTVNIEPLLSSKFLAARKLSNGRLVKKCKTYTGFEGLRLETVVTTLAQAFYTSTVRTKVLYALSHFTKLERLTQVCTSHQLRGSFTTFRLGGAYAQATKGTRQKTLLRCMKVRS